MFVCFIDDRGLIHRDGSEVTNMINVPSNYACLHSLPGGGVLKCKTCTEKP